MKILAPVHAMWLGPELSGLELLTLASFRAQGHAVTLWAYDEIKTPIPPGVALRDAETILPRARITPKREADPIAGIGKGSVGGVFSDLFRYRVLYEHGGIWTDMDVTALKPLDFPGEYAFRPHRLGMVGSIMQCPKGSRLMQEAYEATEAVADADTPWLLPIQILNALVRKAELEGSIIPGMTNLDSWSEIRPFIEDRRAFPQSWHAVHWMNELWRTLHEQNGYVNGAKMTERVPDKNAPPRGSMLHELYRAYGLNDMFEPYSIAAPGRASLPTAKDLPQTARRIDMLLPAIAPGGAERIVLETLGALTADTHCRLHVLGSAPSELPVPKGVSLHRPSGSRAEKLRAIAYDLLAASAATLHTHLIRAEDLETLWGFGIATIPVLHNARPGWQDSPTRYNVPHVPLVVACAESVAAQARESGLTRPLTVLRHELQAHPTASALARDRAAIRRRHGITDDTVLIGMVGQFKLQKAYHRAAAVLAAFKAMGGKARLMILGGWDHEWGSGRTAYETFMRAALESGVVADIICPGVAEPAAPYYAAFDVVLNTSAYEGYSVAMLEALAAGCPVVAADVGGARELPQENVTLIATPDEPEPYAEAILDALGRSARIVPAAPLEPALIPRLWQLLGAVPREIDASWTGALVLIQALERGGPASSLIRLAEALPPERKLLVGVAGPVLATHEARLKAAGAKLLSAAGLSLTEQARTILGWVARYRPRTLCVWYLRPELKLLLAKLLEASPLRLVDVSPGPMLFDEMEAATDFARRIAFTPEAYFARLDCFVSLYKGGEAPAPARNVTAPLGVPEPPSFVPLPPPWALPSPGFDPKLVVGTICRLVPDKNVEMLLGVARRLRERVPGAVLMVVGGPDAGSVPYAQALMAEAAQEPGIIFTGPCDNPFPFLRLFRVFLLAGQRQGCPNASLEAMAMGLPVVAQPDGGIAEQVRHGVTGYLAETEADMAEHTATLLQDEALRTRLGEAGRALWHTSFCVDAMKIRYDKVLFKD